MAAQAGSSLMGIARTLVKRGVIGQEAAEKANQKAQEDNVPFVAYIVGKKLADPTQIARVASEEFGIPMVDLDAVELGFAPTENLTASKLAERHVMSLFGRHGVVYIAVSDPANLGALDEIKFQTGKSVEPIIVEEHKLAAHLASSQKGQDVNIADLAGDDLSSSDMFSGKDDDEEEVEEVEDAAVVGFVNKILLTAIRRGASDIHFEPYEKYYRVRYRQDGILEEGESPPLALSERIAARIKVIANLDISERRVPQDGRIKLKLSKTRAIDFRVSTCPTLFGEKTVMRLLDPSSAQLGIDMLGYEPEQKKLFLDALEKPQGMILVTGPTGSGKTVSLYTGLNILNTPDRNISTAEDPAEINLAGINQVNVNPKVGLTFASALKAFLRQDPDIIMVGEIRDIETGEIAVKAAQTGHLVLSTLHTNDAPQTINRMVNMGIPPFNIASSLTLVIAQRLARRLCKHCKAPMDLPDEVLRTAGFSEADIAEGFKVFGPVGCDNCTGGYKGRVGIYQVMPISEDLAKIIMQGGNSIDIAKQAEKEGIPDLRKSGLLKIKQGVTSLEEVNRVTTD